MSFLQLVLSLDKTIRDLILFCRQCHSDPYRNSYVFNRAKRYRNSVPNDMVDSVISREKYGKTLKEASISRRIHYSFSL